MKKYFLLSVAAVGLMFGCQKKELSNGNESINNEGPVQVKMNIDVPSAVIPATKGTGSVDEWGSQKLTLLAYAAGEDWSKAENSLFTSPIVTNAPDGGWGPEAVVVKQTAKKADGTTDENAPVYYKDNRAYDFFGYYLDDLTGELKTTADGASIELEINGTQDIMAAKTNIPQDVDRAGMTGKIDQADVYSAFSARRGVVPCVRFEHMLSRFNFYVVAASQSAADIVSVEQIIINTPVNGTLQVAGKGREAFAPTFTKAATATGVDLTLMETDDQGKMTKTAKKAPYAGFLKDIDAFKNQPNTVLAETHAAAAKIGSCVMVMPGEASHKVVVKTKNTRYPELLIPDLELEIKASDIKDPNDPTKTITNFAAGYQYDVILMIYGPEEVKVDAYLSEWINGGYYAHDPEEDDIIEITEPKAALEAAEATSLTFEVEVPNSIQVVYAALKNVKDGKTTDWKTVTPTRSWKTYVTFNDLTPGQEYECLLSYFVAGSEVPVDIETGVKGVPSEVTARGALHVFDLDSYIAIPKAYRENDSYDGRAKYIALYYDAVEGAKVTVTFNGAATKVTDATVPASTTLTKFTATDLFENAKELKPGKYEITMSKGTSTSSQTVIIKDPNFVVNKLYVVKDEGTYAQLPAMYRRNNSFASIQNKLPWIVAEITDYDTPLVEATLKGGKTVNITFVTYSYNMLVLDKVNLEVESLTGEWTIDINNVVNTIKVE